MKWVYVIILVALGAVALSNETLRGFLFSSSETEQAPTEEASDRPHSARVEEAGSISDMHGEVSR